MTPNPIQLTPGAVSRIREFALKDPKVSGKPFRVAVEGGGCSGFQYDFKFDDKQAEDLLLNFDGVEVVLDPTVLPYIEGSIVDYVDSFKATGFVVNNPKAKGNCGCGESFSV